MKVLIWGEWNLQRYTVVPLRGCTPSVLLWCGLFFVFFSAAFSMCLGDKSVARSLPVCTVWAPTLKLAADPADSWALRWRETKSVFEIPACSHLPQFVIVSKPAQPSYTSVFVPLAPTSPAPSDGQPSAKTHQGHSTWIKDSVAGHTASDMSHCC